MTGKIYTHGLGCNLIVPYGLERTAVGRAYKQGNDPYAYKRDQEKRHDVGNFL